MCAAAKQMVCAYLMSTEGLSVSEAVDSVRAKRRVICPNIGFMQQLRLWEEMGCRLEDSNPQYRSAADRHPVSDVLRGLRARCHSCTESL